MVRLFVPGLLFVVVIGALLLAPGRGRLKASSPRRRTPSPIGLAVAAFGRPLACWLGFGISILWREFYYWSFAEDD
ncbi:MAG: hypothetical protein K2R98_07205 [Gemmataceae bacterium]|nr:hypothetical protein [Gemmataceae bacterium]